MLGYVRLQPPVILRVLRERAQMSRPARWSTMPEQGNVKRKLSWWARSDTDVTIVSFSRVLRRKTNRTKVAVCLTVCCLDRLCQSVCVSVCTSRSTVICLLFKNVRIINRKTIYLIYQFVFSSFSRCFVVGFLFKKCFRSLLELSQVELTGAPSPILLLGNGAFLPSFCEWCCLLLPPFGWRGRSRFFQTEWNEIKLDYINLHIEI